MPKVISTEEFIERAKEIHHGKYNYDKTKYLSSNTEVIITCPVHGDFLQKPHVHLLGCGCPQCGLQLAKDKMSLGLLEFLKRANEVHNNYYDYSKVNYINSETKVIIICPIHGEFEQTPSNHLRGQGCPVCAGNIKSNTAEFIEKARQVHGDEYDYSKVNYVNALTKVTIICPIHGEFEQTPGKHLIGCGCPNCKGNLISQQKTSNTAEFIEKARQVHGDKYDYSKVNYVNALTKVTIICPIHGEFEQTPNNHLYGKGCPGCNSSRLEEQVQLFLNQNRIKFVYQKSWDWLIYKRKQFLDFYLPEYNVGIECQGIQHFTDEGIFEKSSSLEERSLRDINKQKLCAEHNIRILYFSNMSTKTNKFNYPYLVIEDLESLVLEIQKPFIWL